MPAPTISSQINNTFLAAGGSGTRDMHRHLAGATSFSVVAAGALDVSGVTQTVLRVPGESGHIDLTLPVTGNWKGRNLIGSAASAYRLSIFTGANSSQVNGETAGARYLFSPSLHVHAVALYFTKSTISLQDIKDLWEKAVASNNGGGLAGKAVMSAASSNVSATTITNILSQTAQVQGSGDASISGGLLTLTAPPEERDPISVTVRASNADGHTDMSFSVRTVSGTVRTGTVAAGQRPPSSTGSIGDWFHDGTEAWRKLDDGVWNSGTTVGTGSGVRIRFSESGNPAGLWRNGNYVLINSNNPSAIPAELMETVVNQEAGDASLRGRPVSGDITMRVGFGFTPYGGTSPNPHWGAAEHPGGVQIRIKDIQGNYGNSKVDFAAEWEENLRYVARHTVNNTDELYIGRVTGEDVAGSTPASDTVSTYAFRFPSTNTDALDWFTNATGGAVHVSEILEVAFVDSRVRGDGTGITSGWIPSSLVGTDVATWWQAYSQDTLPTLSAPSVSLPEAGQALRVSAPTLAPNAASWEYQYRAAGGTWLDANIAAGSTPSTDITGLTNGTEYEVRVRQLPFAGATWNTRSAWSTVARGTPLPPALATPNLQASNIVRGDRRLTINRPTPPDAGTDRWQLVMTHPGGSNNQVVNGTSVTVSGLDPDVDYSISIEWIPQRGYRRSARSASVTTHPYGASLGIPNPSPLTEYNLDNATVQVDLHARTPEYDSAISASDFSLSNAPSGVAISNAARTGDRRATLTFSFGAAADFDADASIGINVAADAYDGGTEALSAGTLSVAATTETAPSFPSSTLQQVQMNYGEAYTRTFDAVDAGHPTPTYSLTFTPSLPSGSPATSVLPTGVSFNSATRVLTFSSTAAPSASGTYTWTAAVRGETSATQTLRADIAGAQAPVPGLALNPRSTSIELSVSISSTNGWRYRYATSSAGLDSATIADVAHGTTTATITGLSAGTTYYVEVQAIGDGGSTLNSDWELSRRNVRTLAAGAAYATLSADAALSEENLNGAVVTVTLSTGTFGSLSGQSSTYYTITGLPAGTTVRSHSYPPQGSNTATITLAHDGTDIDSSGSISVVVKAAAHSGNADLAAASITYSATVESRPDVPVDLAVETRDTALSLSWSTVSGADGYQTRYKENSSPDVPASWTERPLLSGRATTYRITGLANGTAYDVSIRSVKRRSTDPDSDRYGIVTAQSHYSSIVTATPQEITIASMGTTPSPLDEGNLNGASVVLESTSADFTEEIGPTDFTVSGVPGVGVASVSRSVVSGKTRATLVLSYDGSDFDAPANMQITTGLAALLPSPGTHKQMSSPIPVRPLPEAVAIALSATTEATLGSSFTLALTLTSETFADPLSLSDFNVTGLPLGTTLDSVVRNSATSATLNASYNGRDFDDNAVVDVDCLAKGLSRAGNILASDTQSASTRTITARNETAALSSPSSPVTEENLGTASFVLSLVGEEFSSTISLSDFSLSMSPAVPSLSLRSVSRTSATSATFFLSPPDGGVDLDSARQMRLTALSSGHTGDDDLQSNAVAIGATDEAAPSAPAGMSVLENDGRLEVSWTDPSDAGILKYQYRLRKTSDAAFQESDWTDIAGSSSTTTSHTFTGLDNGDTYQVQTRAIKNFRFPPGTASVAATATPNRPGAELSSLVPSTGTGTVTESDLDGARAVVDLIAARNFVASPTHGMFRLPTWGGNLGARYEGTFVQSGSMLAVVARRPLPSYWFNTEVANAGNRSVDAILIGTTGGGTLELRLGTADSTVGPQLEATVRNALGLKLESGEHSYTKYGFTGSEPYTETDSSLADFFSHVSAGDAVTVTIWDGSALTVEDSSGVVRNSNTRVTLALAVKAGIDFDFPLHFAVDVLPAAHNGPETLTTEFRTVAPVVEYATASLSNRTHLDEENLPGAEVVLTLHGDTFDSEAVVENLDHYDHATDKNKQVRLGTNRVVRSKYSIVKESNSRIRLVFGKLTESTFPEFQARADGSANQEFYFDSGTTFDVNDVEFDPFDHDETFTFDPSPSADAASVTSVGNWFYDTTVMPRPKLTARIDKEGTFKLLRNQTYTLPSAPPSPVASSDLDLPGAEFDPSPSADAASVTSVGNWFYDTGTRVLTYRTNVLGTLKILTYEHFPANLFTELDREEGVRVITDRTLHIPLIPDIRTGSTEMPQVELTVTATKPVAARQRTVLSTYTSSTPLNMSTGQAARYILSYFFLDPGQPDDSRLSYSASIVAGSGEAADRNRIGVSVVRNTMTVTAGNSVFTGDPIAIEAFARRVSKSFDVSQAEATRFLKSTFTVDTGLSLTHRHIHIDGTTFQTSPSADADSVTVKGNWFYDSASGALTVGTAEGGTFSVAYRYAASIVFYAKVSEISLEYTPEEGDLPDPGTDTIVTANDNPTATMRLDSSFSYPEGTTFQAHLEGEANRVLEAETSTGLDLITKHNPTVTRFSRIPPTGNAPGNPVANAWKKDGAYKATNGLVLLTGKGDGPRNFAERLSAGECPDPSEGSVADIYINQGDHRAFLRGRGVLSPFPGFDGDFISPVSGILWREENLELRTGSLSGVMDTGPITSTHSLPASYTTGSPANVTSIRLPSFPSSTLRLALSQPLNSDAKGSLRVVLRSQGKLGYKFEITNVSPNAVTTKALKPGLTIQSLTLTGTTLESEPEGIATDVNVAGEWHYDRGTGVLTVSSAGLGTMTIALSDSFIQHNVLVLNLASNRWTWNYGYQATVQDLENEDAFLMVYEQTSPLSELVPAGLPVMGSAAASGFTENSQGLVAYTGIYDANRLDMALVDASVRCNGGLSTQTVADVLNPWVPLELRLLTEDDVAINERGCPEGNKGNVLDILIANDGKAFIKGLEPFTSAIGSDTGIRARTTVAGFRRSAGNSLGSPLPLPKDMFVDGEAHSLVSLQMPDTNILTVQFDSRLTEAAAMNMRFVLRRGTGRLEASPPDPYVYYVFGLEPEDGDYSSIGLSVSFESPSDVNTWLPPGSPVQSVSIAVADIARRCEAELATNPWIIYDTLTTEDTYGVREFVFAEGETGNVLPPATWPYDDFGDGGKREGNIEFHDDFMSAIKGKSLVGDTMEDGKTIRNGVDLRGTYLRMEHVAPSMRKAKEEGCVLASAHSPSGEVSVARKRPSVVVVDPEGIEDLETSLSDFLPVHVTERS